MGALCTHSTWKSWFRPFLATYLIYKVIFHKKFLYRHNAGIKSVVPEPNGTKLILLDVKASGYVFNPINDELLVIRSFPENVKVILWDNSITDKDIFVVLDHNNVLHTFIINPGKKWSLFVPFLLALRANLSPILKLLWAGGIYRSSFKNWNRFHEIFEK